MRGIEGSVGALNAYLNTRAPFLFRYRVLCVFVPPLAQTQAQTQ